MLVILMYSVFTRQYRDVIPEMAGTVGVPEENRRYQNIRRAKFSK